MIAFTFLCRNCLEPSTLCTIYNRLPSSHSAFLTVVCVVPELSKSAVVPAKASLPLARLPPSRTYLRPSSSILSLLSLSPNLATHTCFVPRHLLSSTSELVHLTPQFPVTNTATRLPKPAAHPRSKTRVFRPRYIPPNNQ
jgi:hypothetical protein